jgi:predicted MFS family arabinose efflux permease
MRRELSERRILLLVAAVQFVSVLDFMMVLPLGPDFARALAIPAAKLGLVGASYTAAAAVSGAVGVLFLDRFDRRRALGVALAGLAVGTAAGAFATDLRSMPPLGSSPARSADRRPPSPSRSYRTWCRPSGAAGRWAW